MQPATALTGLATEQRLPILCQEGAVDSLSEVLRMVRLTSAVFHLVEASYPGVEVPRCATMPHHSTAPSTSCPTIILKGTGWAILPGSTTVPFEAGDIWCWAQRYSLLDATAEA